MNIYPRLRKSTIDCHYPDNYVKIKIIMHKKQRNDSTSYNGLEIRYCKLGICDSERKFCNTIIDRCVYETIKKVEQPRVNSKDYNSYLAEVNLQMTAAFFKNSFTDQLESAIYGELPENDYKDLLTTLCDKPVFDYYNIDKWTHYNPLIRDLHNALIIKKQQEKSKQKTERSVVFSIGDYFKIDIPQPIPVIRNEEDKIIYSNGWILKNDFSVDFLKKLDKNKVSVWSMEDYNYNLKLLKKQLEEQYGLITMLKLQGYN